MDEIGFAHRLATIPAADMAGRRSTPCRGRWCCELIG
jgi:hypothetical protein